MKIDKLNTLITIVALTIAGHLTLVVVDKQSDLTTIIDNQKLERSILKSQIQELVYNLQLQEHEIYNKGFEAGKTQMGIAMINGDALVDYKDGYHAALSQFEKENGDSWPKGLPKPPHPADLPGLPFPGLPFPSEGLTKGNE